MDPGTDPDPRSLLIGAGFPSQAEDLSSRPKMKLNFRWIRREMEMSLALPNNLGFII